MRTFTSSENMTVFGVTTDCRRRSGTLLVLIVGFSLIAGSAFAKPPSPSVAPDGSEGTGSAAKSSSTTTTDSNIGAAADGARKKVAASPGHEAPASVPGAVRPQSSTTAKSSSRRRASVAELREYIEYYAEEMRKRSNDTAVASWAYATNITDANSAKKVAASLAFSSWTKAQWKANISAFDLSILDGPEQEKEEIRRLYKMVKVLGMAALDDEKNAQRVQLITDMQTIYSEAKICPYEEQACDLGKQGAGWALEPEITDILKKNVTDKSSYDLLAYVWEKWRDASGRKMRHKFLDYARLSNEGALANNLPEIKNAGDLWLEPYESENFRDQVMKLYDQLKPFYQQLHAFVRHKLRGHFGEDKIDARGPLPAHVFGNMWAQSWDALFPIVSEFKAPSLDVTDEMKKQNYTVRRMFRVADDFFTGIGLAGVDEAATDFYGLSMLEKPTDGRKVVCHASAWDFSATNRLPGDFRIKMCTSINMEDLVTVHHELGHIQYYMQYVDLSPLFRSGANPGFHEAIGDTLALSAGTTQHLKSVGLLDEGFQPDHESQLAFLLKTALTKIAFLPFGYLVDLYRWRVFDGSISSADLNAEWWKLREAYQGIVAPVPRSEEDFDPGAKFHVAASVPYIRYFVAHILQFTFHQALCEAAGRFDPKDPDANPLYNCSIGGSKEAGKKLKKLLQAGSSKHWQETLFELNGSQEMSVEPLLNYFKPLRDYLAKYIADNNVYVGWERAA